MKMSQNIRIWKMSPSLVRVMKSRNLRWHGNNKCVWSLLGRLLGK